MTPAIALQDKAPEAVSQADADVTATQTETKDADDGKAHLDVFAGARLNVTTSVTDNVEDGKARAPALVHVSPHAPSGARLLD